VNGRARVPDHVVHRAFGLELELGFPVAGLSPAAGLAGERRVRVELGRNLQVRDAERVSDLRLPGGQVVMSVDRCDGGYLFWAEGFGTALVAHDGGSISCDPLPEPGWRWQRFLTGQVLPFAALLHGLEVFHASAVVIDGRAAGIVAHSSTGKTSLALALALGGRRFLTDDVLVLEPDAAGGGLLAHPGAGVANVRDSAHEHFVPGEIQRLGPTLGHADGESRLALEPHGEPVPLGALFFVRRGGRLLSIERLDPVDPRQLLGATFNFFLQLPDRLTRQLEVCARIDATVDVFDVRCPPGVGARELAELIEERACRAPEPA
jgi:hypothetical protein